MTTRRPRTLLAIVLLLAAAALLVRWPFSSKTWWVVIEDLGHVPLFALLTAALFGVFRARALRSTATSGSDGAVRGLKQAAGSDVRTYVLTALSAAVLAFGSELAQIPVGRDASWTDIRNDGFGIAISLALLAAVDSRLALGRPWRLGLVALAAIALIPIALPVINAARAYSYRASLFPRLADFSTDRDSYWTIGLGVRREFRPGALEVEFVSGPYPSVTWYEPEPDWRGYQWLMLDVENPDDVPVVLTLRVHDQQHRSGYSDRFNYEFELAPGQRRQVRVALDDVAGAPRTRRMDMANVAGVAVLRSGPPGPRGMNIYALSLEGPRY